MNPGTQICRRLCIHQIPLVSSYVRPIRNFNLYSRIEVTRVHGNQCKVIRLGQVRDLSTRKVPKDNNNQDSKKTKGSDTIIHPSGNNASKRTPNKNNTLDSTETSATIPTTSTSTPKSKKDKSIPSPKQTSGKTQTQSNANPLPDYKDVKIPPHQEFAALQSLVDELLATNSSITKRAVLTQHPKQAPLLAWIYDPLRQFFVTSTTISKHAQLRARQLDESSTAGETTATLSEAILDNSELSGKKKTDAVARSKTLGKGYKNLSSLLNALSTRAISGHTALDAILIFMDRFCSESGNALKGTDGSKYQNAVQQLFDSPRSKLLLKILDKNLKTGCNLALIRDTYPTLIPGFHVSLGQSLSGLEEARKLFKDHNLAIANDENAGDILATSTRTKKKKQTKSKSKESEEGWFASRKLDGVRCLIRVDRHTGGIETLSRNGRSFESLTAIQEALRQVISSHSGVQKSDDLHNPHSWDVFFKRALGYTNPKEKMPPGETLPDVLYLDGEVCIFMKEPTPELENDDIKSEGLITIGESEGGLGKENFLRSVSYAKRGLSEIEQNLVDENKHHEETVDKDKIETGLTEAEITPVYCVFDCLTDVEFNSRTGSRPFSARIQGIANALSSSPSSTTPSQGTGASDVSTNLKSAAIKVLKQTKIENVAQLEKMIAKSANRGWEGIMLRKDIGYEGKRSRNMLKVKQFHDAEFTVQEAMVGSMRVTINGQYKERDNVLTNVVILHRGNKVRVGSGFSMEDRVRFGKDPSLIIGKTITVQYFEESQSMTASNGGRDRSELSSNDKVASENNDGISDAVCSLRFPTVKVIYEDGPRQI
ncbi:hypothetical protein BGZ46_004402 [Entomortierella lignicola]|nr:hypothetical protein BGZ46_004402 [Entomortierella lignicola]